VISNMFFQECELLALKYPDLEKQIIKIDILLYRVGENGVIRPGEAAAILSESESQVLGILKELFAKGLLENARYIECPHCENLIVPEDFETAVTEYGYYECSQCFRRLEHNIETNTVMIYTLKHSKIPVSKKFKDLPKPFKVFYSYAHEDEGLRNQLEKHLSPLKREGLIRDWHDRKILPGSSFGTEIDTHLREANIILLLVSSDFFASDYCYSIEMQFALAKHKNNELVVIPIIIRECDWSHAPFAELLALPTDGRAATSKSWNSVDEAFTIVVKGIRAVITQN
jgi:hypothetical protein